MPRGRSTSLPAAEAVRAAQVAKLYCARTARTVCETSIQVHGGIGNTWECLAHVYLRRALTSDRTVARQAEEIRPLDFRDSPEEAAFRQQAARLAGGRTPRSFRPPATSTGRKPGDWHRRSMRGVLRHCPGPRSTAAKIFRPSTTSSSTRSWPAPALRPGRASAIWWSGWDIMAAGNCTAVPARHDQRHRTLVPGLLRARRGLRPGVVDHHRHARGRPLCHQRAQDLDQLLRCRRLVSAAGPDRSGCPNATAAFRHSFVPCISRESNSARCR